MTNALLTPDTPAVPQPEGLCAHPVQPQRTMRKPQLPALTGIRTLLAVNIVLFHFTPPHMGPFYPLIDNSYVFVGFFILLSGFVLSYNYGDRPRLVKRDFWIARFARLYPIYLLSLLMFVHMLGDEWHARSHGEFALGVILTPLMMQSWSPELATFWNTVAWTLSCEAVFYIAFPWLIKLPWPKSAGKLVAAIVGVWALGLVPHTLYMLLNPDHLPGQADRYSSGFWIRTIKYTPCAYLCTFLTGIGLAKLHAALKVTHWQRAAIAALSLLALVIFFDKPVEHTPYILLHGGLLMPLFSALVIGLSGQNIFAAAFSVRPLMLLGQASYALFLLHFNFINLLHRYDVMPRLHLAAYDPWVTYAATLALSVAAMYLVESPARNFILSRVPRRA